MDSVLVPYSSDHYHHLRQQPIAPHKQIRSNIHGGLLMSPLPPPSLSYSYTPPANPLFNHPILHNHNHIPLNPQQPPLLPLPISRPYSSLPCRSRSRSRVPFSSPTNKKPQSLTPKKPKQPMKRKEDLKQTTQAISDCLVMAPAKPTGPDPNGLPKSVSRVMTEDLEKFPDSVFTLSPPPSSLPLPKFPLRPKISCKAEAAGIDTGATDNLRRMLRLR